MTKLTDHTSIELKFTYTILNSMGELLSEHSNLFSQAIEISKKAYSPYSHIQVGAAVLLNNQEIISANNQENASYPLGLCAERLATFYTHSQFPKENINTIAIYGYHTKTQYPIDCFPCGSCRGVLREFEIEQNQAIQLIVGGENGKIYLFNSIEILLPLSFH